MTTTDLLMKAMLTIAFCAAAILGVLWLAFACKELWQIHTLTRLKRTNGAEKG